MNLIDYFLELFAIYGEFSRAKWDCLICKKFNKIFCDDKWFKFAIFTKFLTAPQLPFEIK